MGISGHESPRDKQSTVDFNSPDYLSVLNEIEVNSAHSAQGKKM